MKRNPWNLLATFKSALALARILPRGAAQQIASHLGAASFFLNKNAREASRANLRCATNLDGSALDDLCRRNFANFLKMLADYFYSVQGGPTRVRALLDEWRGLDNVLAARERGKGTIVVTAHLGNWELGALLLVAENLPLTIITLEEPTSELTRWRENYRQSFGIKTIAVGSNKFAFIEMINCLRRNELVAMLIDRPYGDTGTHVDFFGRDSFISTAPALLFEHTGASVLPAFVLQNERGGYVSFAEPSIEMRAGEAHEHLAENTQRVASVFERIIRQHAEQWYNFVPLWKNEN